MSVAIYSESVDTDITPECEFANRLLQAWAAWSYGGGRLGCGSYGDVLDLPAPNLTGCLSLTEEQFLAVDRAVAQLPGRFKRLAFVHYCSGDSEPMLSRYRRLGCSRLEYRMRMTGLHSALYSLLMPAVEHWRHLVL